MKSFEDIGRHFVSAIQKLLQNYTEIHFIFDRYECSPNPKTQERSQRYEINSQCYDISANRPIPEWNKIRSSNIDENNFILFLCDYIERHIKVPENLSHPRKVYLAGGYKNRVTTREITTFGSCEFKDLSCNHIEADTRIIAHIIYVGLLHPNASIVVKSPDTDVIELLISHYMKLSTSVQIWFQTGKITSKADLRRFIPVHEIVKKLGREFSFALPIIHVLSGCDTTSAMFNIGKQKAYNTAIKMTGSDLIQLSSLGESLTPELISIWTRYISSIYDTKIKFIDQHDDINALRLKLSISKQMSMKNLPPSNPALFQHLKRCYWQANIWYKAHIPVITELDPIEFGWKLENGTLFPIFFEGPTALELLQRYICNCSSKKTSCTTALSCTCTAAKVKCCKLCRCNEKCSLQPTESNEDDASFL